MSNEIKVVIPRNQVVFVSEEGNPLFVEPLAEGEKLVEVGTFSDHVKPLWDELANDFIESATPEEIEMAKPKVSLKKITEEEKAADLLKVIALNIMNDDTLLKTFGIEPRSTT